MTNCGTSARNWTNSSPPSDESFFPDEAASTTATTSATSINFDDLKTLRERHARLVKEQGGSDPSAEFLDEVEQYLIRAQATGRILGEDDDRVAAQTIIDFWGTVLLRAHRPLPPAAAHGLAEFAAPSASTSLRDQTTSDYLAEERAAIRNRLRLSAAAAQWSEKQKHPSLLWGAGQLVDSEKFTDLDATEKEFVAASRRHDRRLREIRRIVVALAFAALTAIILLLWRTATLEKRSRQETRHELAAKLVERAGVSAREGDIAGSALWLVEALRTDTAAGRPEDIHRVRLGAAMAQLPRLARILLDPNARYLCNAADFSPDGKSVLTVANAPDNSAGAAHLWDAASGKQLADFASPGGRINKAVVTAQGQVLIATGQSGSTQGGVRSWDPAHQEIAGFEDLQQPVIEAVLSPDGDRVAVICEEAPGSAAVHVREMADGKDLTGPLSWGGPIRGVAFSPDGDHIVACGADSAGTGAVRVWGAWDGAESNVDPFPRHPLPVNAAVFSPDSTPASSRIATASGKVGTDGGEIQVWDPFTGTRLFRRPRRCR